MKIPTVLICILSAPRTLPIRTDEDVAKTRHDGNAGVLRLAATTGSYTTREP